MVKLFHDIIAWCNEPNSEMMFPGSDNVCNQFIGVLYHRCLLLNYKDCYIV